MKKIKLGELDCFISDGNYSSKYPKSSEFLKEGIPFIRCNNFKNNSIVKDDMYFISEKKHSELLKGHLKTGDVLITTRGSLGQVAIVPKEYDDANINAQIVLLRPNPDKIYNKYLMWCLKSKYVQKQIFQNKTGTALQQLPVGRLKKIEINIIEEVDKQKEIVEKIEKVNHIIILKQNQINYMKELIKSQFIEMFENKNFEKVELKSVSEVKGRVGWKGYTKADLRDSGPLVLGATHLSDDGLIDLSEPVFLSREKYEESPEIMIEKNDIIFAQRGSLGKIGLVKDDLGDATINPCVLILRPHNINPEFFRYLLIMEYDSGNLARLNSGSTIPMISQKTIGEFKIILPDQNLQNKFAEFVKRIDKQKFEIQKSLEEMQLLQESLMNKYFGEM